MPFGRIVGLLGLVSLCSSKCTEEPRDIASAENHTIYDLSLIQSIWKRKWKLKAEAAFFDGSGRASGSGRDKVNGSGSGKNQTMDEKHLINLLYKKTTNLEAAITCRRGSGVVIKQRARKQLVLKSWKRSG